MIGQKGSVGSGAFFSGSTTLCIYKTFFQRYVNQHIEKMRLVSVDLAFPALVRLCIPENGGCGQVFVNVLLTKWKIVVVDAIFQINETSQLVQG